MRRSVARVEIADPRRAGAFLRLSWHATQQVVVVSQWRDGVCVATTPVGRTELRGIVDLLVDALHEMVVAATPSAPPSAASVGRDLRSLLARWARPRLAPVVTLGSRHRRTAEATAPRDTTVVPATTTPVAALRLAGRRPPGSAD